MSDFYIRRATIHDVATITRNRYLMFEEDDHFGRDQLDAMTVAFQKWLPERLTRDEYLGWFMAVDERVAAGIGLWLRERSPTPRDLSLKVGHFCDVYTYPEFRRRGFARHLFQAAFDWCATNQITSFSLAASDQGRPLYESLGFEADQSAMIKGLWQKNFSLR